MSSQGGTCGDIDDLVDSGGIGGGGKIRSGKIDFDFELVELDVDSKEDGGIYIHRGNPQTASRVDTSVLPSP